MTEHRLLDELLHRRMEALEEMEGEQDSLQDGFVESRRLMRRPMQCTPETIARDCPLCVVPGCWRWRECRSGKCTYGGNHRIRSHT
jgi:hypothetical protein